MLELANWLVSSKAHYWVARLDGPFAGKSRPGAPTSASSKES